MATDPRTAFAKVTKDSEGRLRAALASRPTRVHPATDNDSSNWSINGASALMLEALCDTGGPATCKMPAVPARRMCAFGGPATGKMRVNPAKTINAKRMAILYENGKRSTRAVNP